MKRLYLHYFPQRKLGYRRDEVNLFGDFVLEYHPLNSQQSFYCSHSSAGSDSSVFHVQSQFVPDSAIMGSENSNRRRQPGCDVRACCLIRTVDIILVLQILHL
jgi:hypothetical protein